MRRKEISNIAARTSANGFHDIEEVFIGGKNQDVPLLPSRILSRSWHHRTFHVILDLPSHKDQGGMK
jgi:hypothetical protein